MASVLTGTLAAFSLVMLLVAYLWALQSGSRAVQVLPSQSAFVYQGRWQTEEDRREADWPCTAVTFDVEAAAASSFYLLWSSSGLGRFNLTVSGVSTAEIQTDWLSRRMKTNLVELPHAGRFTVSLRKLSGSHPLGTGTLGSYLPARWAFHGLDLPGTMKLLRPSLPERRIEFIGSGEALGFGLDAAPEQSFLSAWLWQATAQNCEAAYPALLADSLDADYQLEALLGVGVVQNAYHHDSQHLFGSPTWLDYWPRPLASAAATAGLAMGWRPQLVVVHVGSDDFNQQGGVPSLNTFRVMYTKLLHKIIHSYGGFQRRLSILALCGGRGKNACRACEKVETAVRSFHATLDQHAEGESVAVQVTYHFLPCGDAGGGPNGHGPGARDLGRLDRQGHRQLAAEIAPKIRSLMAW